MAGHGLSCGGGRKSQYPHIIRLQLLHRMRIYRTLLVLCLLLSAGCFGRPGLTPVDAEQARQVLNISLENWKRQASPESLEHGSPSIMVQDTDWEYGMKLVAYKVLGPGQEQDAVLRCPVELVLRDRDGKEQRKTVRYLVRTSPSAAVFREILP